MKKVITLILAIIVLAAFFGCGSPDSKNNGGLDNGENGGGGGSDLSQTAPSESAEGVRLQMQVGTECIYIGLIDNSASRDLVSKLKLSDMVLTFEDFAGSEKIAYPSSTIDISDTMGCDPIAGDVTLYKPWGNFAIFYEDSSSYSQSLGLLGRIENNGIKILAKYDSDFIVTLSLID